MVFKIRMKLILIVGVQLVPNVMLHKDAESAQTVLVVFASSTLAKVMLSYFGTKNEFIISFSHKLFRWRKESR